MDLELSSGYGLRSGATRPLVLAADDDEDNLLLLVHALGIFGFANISTLEGQMVLKLARQYQPDLILLDLILPDLSGVEVIRQLKQDPLTSSIPVVAVTALTQLEDNSQLTMMGCAGYLYKPYDLEELESMLHSHLKIQTPSVF